jgi:hypothetical protein
MADSNLLKRSLQNRFDSSDPFAELTRIMGREPRAEAPGVAEDPFDIDLEKELMGDLGDGLADAPEPATEAHAPEAYAAVPEHGEARFAAADERAFPASADDNFAAEFDEVDWDGEPGATVAEGAEDRPEAAYAPAPDWQAQDWQEADESRATAIAAPEPFADDLGLAEVDMDFGELDVDDRPDAALPADDASIEESDEAAYEEPLQVAAYEAEPQGRAYDEDPADDRPELAAPQADEPSLEDELTRLLGGGSRAQAAQPSFAAEPSYNERDYAAETGYARANHAVPDDADAYDAPVAEDADEAWQEAAAEPEPSEVAAAEPATDPFAVFSHIAPAMPALRRTHAAPVAHAETDAAAAEMFDVDTVDVADDRVPAQDDLDLPETQYDEPTPVYDDFDAEFAASFGQPRAEQPQAEPAPAGYGDDQFAEAIGLSGAAAAAAASGWGARAQAATQAGDDLDRDIGVGSYETAAAYEPAAPAPQRRRNGLVVAAAVAAIAVLGGAGALALSFSGGEGSDTPVLVKADAEPLKVKPENPGGATVPNQDSKAYERASGVVDTTPPEQEKLVTSTEEPMTLATADKADDTLVPGVDEADEADAGAAGAKSEDRLAAAPEPEGVGAAEDLATVQPRKVRTMVVRPDGTLVPREEPVAAPAPQQVASAQTPEAAAAVAAPAAQAIREVAMTPPQQPVAELAAPATAQPQPTAPAVERTVTVPEKGPVVPQRPAEAPAAAAPQQQQQVAQAAAPARAQPARPEPAAPQGASDWSMQIASQPTAEAAQSTYQDLARRYGGVLGGRGVNIVKAEIAGKGTYYRVRVPSATRDDAIALCEKYKAAGGSCFVSK